MENTLHRDAMITLPGASLPAKSRVGAWHGAASAVNSIMRGGDNLYPSSRAADGTKYPSCRGILEVGICLRNSLNSHRTVKAYIIPNLIKTPNYFLDLQTGSTVG